MKNLSGIVGGGWVDKGVQETKLVTSTTYTEPINYYQLSNPLYPYITPHFVIGVGVWGWEWEFFLIHGIEIGATPNKMGGISVESLAYHNKHDAENQSSPCPAKLHSFA
ncbi:MAG: hypothetical protein VKL59_18095 [Nostocaceae cyanobacterium]|nr:hypothetical protein [Nostocaceae cyanobacterium]